MGRIPFAFVLFTTIVNAGNFIPIQQGNSWTYRQENSTQQFTVKVGTPQQSGKLVYYPLSGYVDRDVLVRYEGDQLLYLDENTGTESVLTSFLPGQTWKAPERLCTGTGEAQGTRATHDGEVGPIEGVLEIRYRTSTCADAGLDLEQYAENIGMVRRAVQTFAGPRNYDLVYATVGRTVLEAAPNGRFTVTLDGIGPDTVTLVLKVQANAAEPLTLEFPSGQEYDVSVRDASGQSVYTWSASRSFLQALHNVTVDREWSATVTIPRPPAGSYTVQAWLTTSGGTPAFAATVPLTLVR